MHWFCLGIWPNLNDSENLLNFLQGTLFGLFDRAYISKPRNKISNYHVFL